MEIQLWSFVLPSVIALTVSKPYHNLSLMTPAEGCEGD